MSEFVKGMEEVSVWHVTVYFGGIRTGLTGSGLSQSEAMAALDISDETWEMIKQTARLLELPAYVQMECNYKKYLYYFPE